MAGFSYVWERKCLSGKMRSVWGWSVFPFQVSLTSLHHSEWEICVSLKGEKWGFACKPCRPHLFFVLCFWAVYLTSLHLLLTPLLPCCECWRAGRVALLRWELALTHPYGSGSSSHTDAGVSTSENSSAFVSQSTLPPHLHLLTPDGHTACRDLSPRPENHSPFQSLGCWWAGKKSLLVLGSVLGPAPSTQRLSLFSYWYRMNSVDSQNHKTQFWSLFENCLRLWISESKILSLFKHHS